MLHIPICIRRGCHPVPGRQGAVGQTSSRAKAGSTQFPRAFNPLEEHITDARGSLQRLLRSLHTRPRPRPLFRRVGPHHPHYPTVEVAIGRIHPVHPVPRSGNEPMMEHLRADIPLNGYKMSGTPVRAIELGNGDLIIYGGHHRVAVLRELGERSVPVHVTPWDRVAPEHLALCLELGQLTGLYTKRVPAPELSPAQRAVVDAKLARYKGANGRERGAS